MKKHDRVKVLGQWVRVEHKDLSVDAAPDENLHGDCNVERRLIRLDQSLEGADYKRVLRHEKMHMKLGLSGLSELLTPEQEEAICVLSEID